MLAVAVLLIKLVGGAVCLVDTPEKRFDASTTVTVVTMPIDTEIDRATADDLGGCLLGEVASCHCACLHSVPLPTSLPLPVGKVAANFTPPTVLPGFIPAAIGSLLRPPIA
ncbi:MAG TPA: hypothetical protein VFL78_10345 [Rhodanobacteraceae bacterium]|nr:hypothetical protein [Rhodanobacteraceae bacterium]